MPKNLFNKVKNFIEAKHTIDNWNYVFEQNPEIEKIGSREEYMEYIKTIFPNTTYKKICFHGGKRGIDKFLPPSDSKFKKNDGLGTLTKDYGIYFTTDLSTAEGYATGYKNQDRRVYSVLLDIRKPFTTNLCITRYIGNFFCDNIMDPRAITKKNYNNLMKEGFDSIIWREDRIIPFEYDLIVFKPEQIYILGTQNDLDNFKKWKQNKNQTKFIADVSKQL